MSISQIWFQCLLALSICMLHATTEATTWILGGVSSNLQVDEGRVFFVQFDGSLTVLDLETGEVLARKPFVGQHESGRFYSMEHGIAWVGNYADLLDRETLEFRSDNAFSGNTPDFDRSNFVNRLSPEELAQLEAQAAQSRFTRSGLLNFYEEYPGDSIELTSGTIHPIAHANTFILHYSSTNAEWFCALPYLRERERIVAVTEHEGKLLLGSDAGHVECVDLASGKSLWLYVFPVLRWSYLDGSDPSWFGDTASAWHRNFRDLPKTVGMVRLPADPGKDEIIFWKYFKDSFTAAVIVDPNPTWKYGYYYWLCLGLWLPVACLIGAMILGPRRGPRWARITLFVIAWPTSLLGVLFFGLLMLGALFGGFTRVHALVWIISSFAFGIMLVRWKRGLGKGDLEPIVHSDSESS